MDNAFDMRGQAADAKGQRSEGAECRMEKEMHCGGGGGHKHGTCIMSSLPCSATARARVHKSNPMDSGIPFRLTVHHPSVQHQGQYQLPLPVVPWVQYNSGRFSAIGMPKKSHESM